MFSRNGRGTDWWQTDGTRDGTQFVDSLPVFEDGPVFHEGTLYFAAIHPQFGDELWRYVAEEETLPGDINDDGTVDVTDFLALSRVFGTMCEEPCDEDLNDDGRVDVADFLVLSRNFGRSL